MAGQPLPDKIPSNPQITLRMTQEAQQEATDAAHLDGFKSRATWIKHLMRQRIEEQATILPR